MFSVVIPLYNKELSIENTLRSVLDQKFQDFEIIIINDGSTDCSVKVVESIKDDRIVLINQQNKGVSSARNSGIANSKYQMVAFLDADDLWKKNHLEEINNMIKLFPGEAVYATSFSFSNNKEVYENHPPKGIFKIENYFKAALYEYVMWTSVVVIDKSKAHEVGYFNSNLRYGEDLDFWARLGRKYSIVKSSIVTASYRLEAENRSKIPSLINHTHAYNFDLNLVLSLDESMYYRMVILDILYVYVRRLNIFNFYKLKIKHPAISWPTAVLYIFRRVTDGFKRAIKR